jgi:hypothetical protein
MRGSHQHCIGRSDHRYRSAPYHILVERALRDEGTSYHYLPASTYAEADPELVAVAANCFARAGLAIRIGATWTTDAPFRETAETIAARRRDGILAVEMEAAALYAFAGACSRAVICLVHVSNKLGCIDGDFEKGEDNGACDSIDLVKALSAAWRFRPNLEVDRSFNRFMEYRCLQPGLTSRQFKGRLDVPHQALPCRAEMAKSAGMN